MYNQYINMMGDYVFWEKNCTTHAQRALRAFKASPKLKPFIDDGTMILPERTNDYNFVIEMPVDKRVLDVSFAIAPDRMGNRNKYQPPSTMEILLRNVFDEYEYTLGYDGDIRSFLWEESFSDNGFEQIINEFIRIRNIINGL